LNKKLLNNLLHKNNNFKILSLILFLIFFNYQKLHSLENKILLKIDNDIITTFDIYEEIKFLKLFNPQLNNLSENEIFEISKNSILKDRIKRIEILKFVKEIKVDDRFLVKLIKNRYSEIGLNSLDSFENYLSKNNLDVDKVKEKISTELIWNDIIFQKFNSKVSVDREEIKKNILENPQKKTQEKLLLSEITFNVDKKVDFEKKSKKIFDDIEKTGFKNAALIHSESSTASNGGLIGWVKFDNINNSIKTEISNLNIGQYSKPVRTSSGFIIVKIEDKKVDKIDINLNREIEEMIRFKTNEQLDQFSNIYFNKIKKDLTIHEL
tara:strand:- start:3124 stop:4095 length:972 start_codon:yes stop_codon:yes gene_type:complete